MLLCDAKRSCVEETRVAWMEGGGATGPRGGFGRPAQANRDLRWAPTSNEHLVRPKNLRIRPRGYFFKLRSILMLPGFKIPLKSEKIAKNRIYKRPSFQKMVKYWFRLMSLYQFFTQNSIPEPKSTPNQPKTRF